MKVVYSILYISLNTAINERVSIGLLMSDGAGTRFRYAADKLAAIKGIMDGERFSFVRSYLKSLAHDMDDTNPAVKLFADTPRSSEWLKVGYMDYLSRYANNLIQFAEPKYIEVSFNDANFNKVFEKYVYASSTEEIAASPSEGIYEQVREHLYPMINGRVNLDIDLDATHFENLFASISVNFIGKNDLPLVGQTIDFEKKHYNLENDLSRFVSLTKAIDLTERNKGKYFILGVEPDSRHDKNHQLWQQIRQSDFLEFVDVQEVEQVDRYIREHGVRPYFGE